MTFAGITLFISDINISSILHLSDKYFSSNSIEYRDQLLSAGESLLASDMWITSNAKIRGIMIELGAVIFSILMFRTNIFSKATGIVGLLAHGFDLFSEILSIFFVQIKQIFTLVGGPLYFLWFILLALSFKSILKDVESS